MSAIPNGLSAARDEAILGAIKDGGLDPVIWMPVDCSAGGHQATVYVTADALSLTRVENVDANGVGVTDALGEPVIAGHVRFGVSARLAQDIADLLGCMQTTSRIEDLSWQQASERLEPQLLAASSNMVTTAYMIKYSERVDRALAGRAGLVRTVGKSWVLSPDLIGHALGPTGAVNYGLHSSAAASTNGPFRTASGLTAWQTLGHRHNYSHSDYSQTLVLVRSDMLVDGQPMLVADVLQDHELCALLSDQGVTPVRHPAVPQTQIAGDYLRISSAPGAGEPSDSNGWLGACALLGSAVVGYVIARFAMG